MKILISGSSGLIGSALMESWEKQGHKVARLVRSHDRLTDDTAIWEPEGNLIDIPKLDWIAGDDGFRAVVNLAGKNIFEGRWNPERKAEIKNSRVMGTKHLSGALGKLKIKPEVLVSASSIGFYGDRGSEILNEESESGRGFLAEVAREWEAATAAASDSGIRVVNSRFGIVLSKEGGTLRRMIRLAKIGGAAPLGEGDQYMSWISIDDTVNAVNHILVKDSLRGPVNVVSTSPIQNVDFSRTLQYYFKAPVYMHVPALLLNIIMGEVAEEVSLASQRVMPVRLRQSGFKFRHTTLEAALRYLTSEKVDPRNL